MEVFILISMAMALSSSSTSSSSLQTSTTESTKDLSSGSFRKSHALLSFFPVLCKNSMSLNHKGDCIKTKATISKRKNANFKVNKNLLKHILTKRRKKKPLVESESENSNSPFPIKDSSIQANISKLSLSEFHQNRVPQTNSTQSSSVNTSAISHHHESHNSSTNLLQEIENNINKDIILDILKSTNVIANILQSKIKYDEDFLQNSTEPRSPNDSRNTTNLDGLDTETLLSSRNTLFSNSANTSDSLVTREEGSQFNKTFHISSRHKMMTKNETNELNNDSTEYKNQIYFKGAEQTNQTTSGIAEEKSSLSMGLNESSSERKSHTASPVMMVVYPTVLKTNLDHLKDSQPLVVTRSPVMDNTFSTPFTTASPSSRTKGFKRKPGNHDYWTIIPSILKENVSTDMYSEDYETSSNPLHTKDLGTDFNTEPKNITENETTRESLNFQNDEDEETTDVYENETLNLSIIEEDTLTLDELLRTKYRNKYPFFHKFVLLNPMYTYSDSSRLNDKLSSTKVKETESNDDSSLYQEVARPRMNDRLSLFNKADLYYLL